MSLDKQGSSSCSCSCSCFSGLRTRWSFEGRAGSSRSRSRSRSFRAPLRSRASSVLAVLAVLAVCASSPAQAQGIGIAVGQAAPAATVQTLDGRPLDLAAIAAKGPTLIEFWAVWCPICKKLEPRLKAAHAKYGKQVRFVGVAVSVNESPASVKRHVARHGTPGEQYFDAKGEAADAYDVPATSFVVVVDREGKVVYTGMGAEQDLEAAIRKALQG